VNFLVDLLDAFVLVVPFLGIVFLMWLWLITRDID
jgi:hypothetical protein